MMMAILLSLILNLLNKNLLIFSQKIIIKINITAGRINLIINLFTLKNTSIQILLVLLLSRQRNLILVV